MPPATRFASGTQPPRFSTNGMSPTDAHPSTRYAQRAWSRVPSRVVSLVAAPAAAVLHTPAITAAAAGAGRVTMATGVHVPAMAPKIAAWSTRRNHRACAADRGRRW